MQFPKAEVHSPLHQNVYAFSFHLEPSPDKYISLLQYVISLYPVPKPYG